METLTMLTYETTEKTRPIIMKPAMSVCGDLTLIEETPTHLFLALFDGAGHGNSAYRVSEKAIQFIKENQEKALTEIILELHEVLLGSLGGVVVLATIEKSTGLCYHTGIGNISIHLFSNESTNFLLRGGVLGYEISNPKLQTTQLKPGDILLLHSDGIKSEVNLAKISEFDSIDLNELATSIFDLYSKKSDDASLILLRVSDD